MGNSVSVDKQPVTLEELLSLNSPSLPKIEGTSTKTTYHLKLWRFAEDPKNPDWVKVSPLGLTQPTTFQATESYLVLLIHRENQSLHFSFPASLQPTVQSLENLTPRGLENVFSSDKGCLESLLLSQRKSEQDLHYMVFVWNGRRASAIVKAVGLTKGFELDSALMRGGFKILSNVFAGHTSKKNTLTTLDKAFSGDSQISQKPDTSVYLLKLFASEQDKPNSVPKPLFPKFKKHFISQSAPSLNSLEKQDVTPPKLKLDVSQKPKLGGLDLAGLKTREEERMQLEKLTKEDLDNLDENLDVRDTNRKEMKMQYYSEVCSEICPGLYVGSDNVARDAHKLKSLGVTHVINCAGNVCKNYYPGEFTYLSFFLKDARTESIDSTFYTCVEFIEEALSQEGKVFVHCMQGVSRSVTVCLAYVIFKKQSTFEEVFRDAKEKRSICSPNFGFQVQLIWWYKRLYEAYDNLPISPRVYVISSHQVEQPHRVVPRLLMQNLFTGNQPLLLDSRALIIIHHKHKTYLWEGEKISPSNREPYLVVANAHLANLVEFEGASEAIHIKENQEPQEFFELWSTEVPSPHSGENSVWDSYFPDLSSVEDQEPQSLTPDTVPEEHFVGKKPKIFIYPELEGIGVFDDDDLAEESVICLCTVDSCIVWRGELSRASEEDIKAWAAKVSTQYHEGSSIEISYEHSGDESDEFMSYF